MNSSAAASPRTERDRSPACVHHLVARQARRAPDADAVLCGDDRISYARLELRAGRLADLLRRRGVGPEVPVGLYLSRSAELAVAVLAVLKAGGVCVPLDPAYPPDRLTFVLRDVGPLVVVTQRRLAPDLAGSSSAVLCLDAPVDEPADEPEPAACPWLHLRNLAWVAYTSGSAGRPKGVGLTHGSLANLAQEIGRRLGLGPGDRVLQFASIGFSVAAEEILSTWAAGACLVIDPGDSLADGAGLLGVVEKRGVTVMQLTPAYWYEWLRELDHDGTLRPPASLRLLVVGSEQVAVDRCADWLSTAARLVQEYGATEGTVSQLLYEPDVDAAELRTWPRLPIGTPLAGVRVHLLDDLLRPVPDGKPGELYIAGDNVARGYLGRPGLTAERFLPDPHGDRPGRRMYRTGDLARRRPDGNLEFLGRIDHQLKIRGIRIEPGEVESAIDRYPGVVKSAVLARRAAATGADQLCACVVWEGEYDEIGLRAHLKVALPLALVPARLVPVADLPLSPNGKVDRRALGGMRELGDMVPVPEPATPGGTGPRAPLEAALAGIWALTLGAPRVGVEDDFFELGGDSLAATRLAAHLREVLAVDARQRMLFEAPTVSALAKLISARRRAADGGDVTAVEPERIPVTSSQRRMWLLHKMAPSSAAYNEPVVLRLRGPLDRDGILRALRQVVRRHTALRATIGSEEGRPIQLIAPPSTAGTFPLTSRDLIGLPEAETARVVAELANAPFDLRRGPLLRASLLCTGVDDHVLVLVFHHVIFDGWSMDVLFRDLSAFYEEALTGAPAELSPLSARYAEHAVRQGGQRTGRRDDAQLAYWERKLSGAPAVTRLPPSLHPAAGSDAIRCPFSVRADAAARLRELAAMERATPFIVLLAGFKALVHRCGGSRDVVVGTLLAGRDHPDTADLIGVFINTVPLRTRFPVGATFRRLVSHVRETVCEAVANQDVSFERVVVELRPPRGRRRSPVFQMMFSYGGTTVHGPELPGLTVTPMGVDTRSAKFDVAVMMEESGCSGYSGVFEYDPTLYDETAAWRFTEMFRGLLESVAENPDFVV